MFLRSYFKNVCLLNFLENDALNLKIETTNGCVEFHRIHLLVFSSLQYSNILRQQSYFACTVCESSSHNGMWASVLHIFSKNLKIIFTFYYGNFQTHKSREYTDFPMYPSPIYNNHEILYLTIIVKQIPNSHFIVLQYVLLKGKIFLKSYVQYLIMPKLIILI